MRDWFDGLPEMIRVGPFDVQVKREPDMAEHWGTYNTQEMVIQVSDAQPSRTHAVYVILHELCHAIWTIGTCDDADKEERKVEILSTGWTQIFRDNPELLEWIASTIE